MNVEYWGRVWLEAIALGRVSNKKAEGWDTPSIPGAALNHSTVLSEDYPSAKSPTSHWPWDDPSCRHVSLCCFRSDNTSQGRPAEIRHTLQLRPWSQEPASVFSSRIKHSTNVFSPGPLTTPTPTHPITPGHFNST